MHKTSPRYAHIIHVVTEISAKNKRIDKLALVRALSLSLSLCSLGRAAPLHRVKPLRKSAREERDATLPTAQLWTLRADALVGAI